MRGGPDGVSVRALRGMVGDMKAYYAHCVALYGKPQEQRDLTLIASLGLTVVNPNCVEVDAIVKSIENRDERMAYFERFADECDLIVFRGLPDGSIPSGVAMEINWFRKRSKPIIELPSALSRRMLSYPETKEYLEETVR